MNFPRLSAKRTLPLLCLFAMFRGPAIAAGDPDKGKAAYAQRCASCHSIEYNGAGPAHRGLLGRKAGTAPGFAYSPALKASSVTWSEDTLNAWLSDPEKFIPGQKMWISVPDPAERQDIIAYLRTETRKQ
jgi:cytochrome c